MSIAEPAVIGRRESRAGHAAAAVITVLVLAPLIRPGYVLSFDMVFVPRQPLRWDLIAPTAGLPRAVPEDAVVSLLSLVAPGWLLQRVALAGAVYLAALGAARLVPATRVLTRVIAAVGYAWSPFLAERLLLGQWGLLLGYAALPWLVAAALGVRAGRSGSWPRLMVAAAPAAITPTGGLLALAVTAGLTARPGWPAVRSWGWAVASVAALNAPWLVAAVTTAAGGRSDPAGVAAFAARGENWAGPLVALAGTGGIWNALTTPASRSSVLVPVVTLGLLLLAGAGYPALRRRWSGGATRLAVVAAVGFVVAAAGTLAVSARLLSWAVQAVPGAGLLRDGQKFLAPYALLLAVCVALGVERLADRLARPRARLVAAAAIALPVLAMPDLAFGGWGQLQPVSYPPDWDRVAAQIAAAPGEVIALPFSEYRTYPWNRGRIVIDPAPRYFDADVLVDDTLQVGGIVVAGEDPQAAQLRRLIAAGRPIASAGSRWVLVEHGGQPPPAVGSLAGLRRVLAGPVLDLYQNPAAPVPDRRSDGRRWLLLAVDLAAAGVFAGAGVSLFARAIPRGNVPPHT